MAHEITPRAANFIPEPSAPSVARTGHQPGQVDIGYEFFNGLSCPITIVNRSGVQMTIPPILSGPKLNVLLIRSKYSLGVGVIVNTHGLLNDQGRTSSKEAEILEQHILRDSDNRVVKAWRVPSHVDYTLTQEDFNANGGILYLHTLDLTLSALDPRYAPKHPYSLKGVREWLEGSDPVLCSQSGLSYRVRIVDRKRSFGSRYVNLAGEVFLIHPITDTEVDDGVYLTSPMPATGMSDVILSRSEYYSFEDAEKLKIFYNSYNEAKTLGNPENVLKRELEDRNQQLKLLDFEQKRERAEYEAKNEREKREFEQERELSKRRQQIRDDELEARETEIRRVEADYKVREQRLKNDQQVLKEIFEDRSHGRKEYIEILKSIPTLLSGVGAMYLAIKKLKGN